MVKNDTKTQSHITNTKQSIADISESIKGISIVHRTGQCRVITDLDEVIDVRFSDLLKSLVENHDKFHRELTIKYCQFTIAQVNRIVKKTSFSVSTTARKNTQFGYLETQVTYHPAPTQTHLFTN